MNLALKALAAPELLTPEEQDIVADWRAAHERREQLIEDLWVSAMLGGLPWPGSER